MRPAVQKPIGGAAGDGVADPVRARLGRRASRLLAAVLTLVGVVALGGAALGAAAPTQAAWSDRTYASATVTAGTWSTSKNTCTALNQGGRPVPCTVKAIRYEGWGNPGSQTRNYYIEFTSPAAKSITFSVDLSTATGTGGTFSWSNAGVATTAQFTPTGGWTCGSLPLVTGKAFDWYTTVYFPVYENKSGQSVMCG